ncbi:hypothetical protein [Mycobacterium sp. M23085]|uniref:hypothetical protein n=1 Tax=Mycobacterium sp. M23085 TaxID=3378087 RepID=UPI0038782130
MAIRVTFASGKETFYDDGTSWEVEHGVLKLGSRSRPGTWDNLVSPSAWHFIDADAEE